MHYKEFKFMNGSNVSLSQATIPSLKYPSINLNALRHCIPFFMFVVSIGFLALVIPFLSLAIFFSVSLLFITLRWYVPIFLKNSIQIIGLTVLTFIFIYYKSPDFFSNHLPITINIFSTKPLSVLGIGYCYLKTISALLDTTMNPWHFARYYFFLPTFFSGPIMTPSAFCSQKISFKKDDFFEGIARIIFGIIKFILSSFMQLFIPLSNSIHAISAIQSYPFFMLWATTILCGIWLYMNFSAFTDIAIGFGRILGYYVPENFNNPFIASDLTDFWRRWHITLGDWLRGHIFNPLARQIIFIFPPFNGGHYNRVDNHGNLWTMASTNQSVFSVGAITWHWSSSSPSLAAIYSSFDRFRYSQQRSLSEHFLVHNSYLY